MRICITSTINFLVLTGTLLSASGLVNASEIRRGVATERFTEYADVIDVQPIYREVRLSEPRQECWTEEHRRRVEQHRRGEHYRDYGREHQSSGNALIGGLIGGVIGNQLGRGHSDGSRAGATIAGAIIGGTLANEAATGPARHRRPAPVTQSHEVYEYRPVKKCREVQETRYEQRLQHYNVTYRYRGRTFTTRLPRDPGARLELQVSVSPARR